MLIKGIFAIFKGMVLQSQGLCVSKVRKENISCHGFPALSMANHPIEKGLLIFWVLPDILAVLLWQGFASVRVEYEGHLVQGEFEAG